MESRKVLMMVSDHLERGGNVQLILDQGRRLVKIVKWGIFGSTYEISGATEAEIQRLMAAKRTKQSAA
jgi:hypothetical protein